MTGALRMAVRCVFCAAVFLLLTAAVPAVTQDVWINEIEFAPYIVMPEELLYMIADGRSDFLIVDIRSRESYERSHIKGADHYEWDEEGKANFGELPSDREIMIISEDGSKSFDLLRYLLRRGYSDVWVVEGGMLNWPYEEYLVTGGH